MSTAATTGLAANTDCACTQLCEEEGEEGLVHRWQLLVSHTRGHTCGPRGSVKRNQLGGILTKKGFRSWRDGSVAKSVLMAQKQIAIPNHGQIH